MDSCVARPDIVEEISAIAKEEAMGYFYGSKSRCKHYSVPGESFITGE